MAVTHALTDIAQFLFQKRVSICTFLGMSMKTYCKILFIKIRDSILKRVFLSNCFPYLFVSTLSVDLVVVCTPTIVFSDTNMFCMSNSL